MLADPAFQILCDVVATDRVVFVTGAGTSAGLMRKGGGTVPNWPDLLRDLQRARRSSATCRLANDVAADVDRLLAAGASGRSLIEAASLLREGWPEFDKLFRRAVTPAARQPSVVRAAKSLLHRAILDLKPRGILTFNYDEEHERAIGADLNNWDILNPIDKKDEARMRDALEANLTRPFLMKAHGSLSSRAPLVLTFQAYRELLVRRPGYLAFVQNLFTNFHLVIVGFSISDPDFDLFLDTMARQFGSPLRPHVVIRGPPEKDAAKLANDVILRRRYGIHSLYAGNYSEIPKALTLAAQTPGRDLQSAIAQCLNPALGERQASHRRLRQLGPSGKRIASRVLRTKIEAKTLSVTDLAETVYSLGALDPPDQDVREANKEALLRVVESATRAEPAAHALDQLADLATSADLPRLEARLRSWKSRPLAADKKNPDPDNRLPVYLERLILRVRAREKFFPRRLRK